VEPFNSRVDPKVPSGWNPTMKLLPQVNKKRRDPNNALAKHRAFLKMLETSKTQVREDTMLHEKLKDMKT